MHRGEVYRLKLPKGVGHEQRGGRYGVVLQADAMLPRSTVLIAPTSQSAPARSYRPEVTLVGSPTRVLVEQVGVYDVRRLGERVGHLVGEDIWSVDEALSVVLSLR